MTGNDFNLLQHLEQIRKRQQSVSDEIKALSNDGSLTAEELEAIAAASAGIIDQLNEIADRQRDEFSNNS